MKIGRIPFVVSGALLGCFGAGFLVAPSFVLGTYGVELDSSSARLVRMFGAAVLALALLSIHARDSDGDAQRMVARTLLVFFLIKAIVSTEAVLGGMFNALGWTILMIDAPLAAMWTTWLLRSRSA